MTKQLPLKSFFGIGFTFLLLISVPVSLAAEPVANSVVGKLHLSVKTKRLTVELKFHFVDKRDSTNSLSLLLTPDVKIDQLTGGQVESFAVDSSTKPFSKIKIIFKQSLPSEVATDFSITYSGVIKKGVWDTTYNWIDLDPDFMNLPIFLNLTNFTYQLSVTSDDPAYKFCDFNRLSQASAIEIKSDVPSYYFHSIVAGKSSRLKTIKRNGYRVHIISTKSESLVNYLGDTAAKILSLYNQGFGRKDTITSFLVVYRPLPDSVLPVIRSQGRSIVFSDDHSRIAVLAHEIGHFWWNRGNAFTTEKWLSESFAEYASYIYTRSINQQEYDNRVIKAQAIALKAPAILGSNRFGSFGDDLLYFKGPYLLSELEKTIGEKLFMDLLINLNQKKVSTTPTLLTELERLTSTAVRADFEEKLKQ